MRTIYIDETNDEGVLNSLVPYALLLFFIAFLAV
jgi:hypothetical protein